MNIIIEGIKEVKALYPHIEDDLFYKLISLDPTYKDGVDSVGKYGKWILNLYKKNNLKEEDFYKVTEYLTEFDIKKRYLTNKDIGQYKTLPDLSRALAEVGDIELSHNQKVKQNKKNRRRADLHNEARLEYEDSDWEVWIPLTYAASCKLGQGTRWCTASTESDEYFEQYTDQGELFININKHDEDEKYQFHFETGSFMDQHDDEIDLSSFLNKNKSLARFYIPHIVKPYQRSLQAHNIDIDEEFEWVLSMYSDIQPALYGDTTNVGDRVPGRWCYELLDDPYDVLSRFEWDEHNYLKDLSPSINNKTEKLLATLGFTKAEFFQLLDGEYEGESIYEEDVYKALLESVRSARMEGTLKEIISDIHRAIKDCFEKYFGSKTVTVDFENVTIKTTLNKVSDVFLQVKDDADLYFDADLDDILSAIIQDKFVLYEPQYGWSEFDENYFLERLYEELLYIDIV